MAFFRSTIENKVIGEPIYLIHDGYIKTEYTKGSLITIKENQTTGQGPEGGIYVNLKCGSGSVSSKFLKFNVDLTKYLGQNKFIICKSKTTNNLNLVFTALAGSSTSTIASVRSLSIVGTKVDSAYPYDMVAVSVDNLISAEKPYFALYGTDNSTSRIYELAIVDLIL